MKHVIISMWLFVTLCSLSNAAEIGRGRALLRSNGGSKHLKNHISYTALGAYSGKSAQLGKGVGYSSYYDAADLDSSILDILCSKQTLELVDFFGKARFAEAVQLKEEELEEKLADCRRSKVVKMGISLGFILFVLVTSVSIIVKAMLLERR